MEPRKARLGPSADSLRAHVWAARAALLGSIFFPASLGFPQVRLAWVGRQDSELPAYVFPKSLAAGPQGAVAVAGALQGGRNAIVTRAYGGDGKLLWKAERAVARDLLEQLWICADRGGAFRLVALEELGQSARGGPLFSIVGLAYAPTGETLWEATYPMQLDRYGASLGAALDPEGTLWIGVSGGVTAELRNSIPILRYDHNGRMLDPIRYEPQGARRQPMLGGLAVDPSGHVLLAATSWSGLAPRALVAKYAPDGRLLWDTPCARDPSWAAAIQADAQGRIYVAGGWGERAFLEARDPEGNLLWEATWGEEEPGAYPFWGFLELDRSGRLCVAGTMSRRIPLPGGTQIAQHPIFAVYSPDGRELWSERAERVQGERIYLRAMAPGGRGGLVAAGEAVSRGVLETFLLAYDEAGRERPLPDLAAAGAVWTAFALSPEGKLLAAGARRYEALTAAYDATGRELWLSAYEQQESCPETPEALALDDAGNVYVVGGRQRALGTEHVTVKWSPSGEKLWVKSHPGGELSPGGHLAVHPDGSVSTGFTAWEAWTFVWTIVRYEGDGAERWIVEKTHAEGSSLEALAADGPCLFAVGNVGRALILVRYDEEGRELWAAHREAPEGAGWAWATGIAVDPQGFAYVAADLWSQQDVLKYTRGGELLWAKTIALREGGSRPMVLLDPSGYPLVWWNRAPSSAVLAKLNTDGDVLWTSSLELGGDYSALTHVAVDPAGDIYLAGRTERADSLRALLKKLSASGRPLWSAEHGLLEGPDVPGGLCPDGRGGVLLAVTVCRGSCTVFGAGDTAIQLLGYDPAGNRRWILGHDPLGPSESAVAMAIGPSGLAHIAAAGGPAETLVDFVVLSFQAHVPPFFRGDCDGDGRAVLSDAIFHLRHAFVGGPEPGCLAACDADGDRVLSPITDAIYFLRALFLGGLEPPPPFGTCGSGGFADLDLGCAVPPGCPG